MTPTMPGHQSQGGVYSSKVRQKRLEILGLERQHKQGLTRCGHRRQCARSFHRPQKFLLFLANDAAAKTRSRPRKSSPFLKVEKEKEKDISDVGHE